MFGAADDRDDVAAAFSGAEQNNRRARKPGRDRDQMTAQIGYDSVGPRRSATPGDSQERQQSEREGPLAVHPCSVLITKRLGGRMVRS